MQAWQRYAKPHGFNDMRKIKAAFQKQLNKCVKQQLIRKVCEATDVDPPFVIYEFDTGNLYTFLLPVFPYLPNTSFFRFFWYVTCPCSFWTKRHVNLFVNNNNNNNNFFEKLLQSYVCIDAV